MYAIISLLVFCLSLYDHYIQDNIIYCQSSEGSVMPLYNKVMPYMITCSRQYFAYFLLLGDRPPT